ncbi:cytochrome bd oxidase small subunit CydS [Desertibacillus haloalkaliphilus]
MHNFMLFYAPLLIVVIAFALSFIIATKSSKYED